MAGETGRPAGPIMESAESVEWFWGKGGRQGGGKCEGVGE
jgi:hypothetical protein